MNLRQGLQRAGGGAEALAGGTVPGSLTITGNLTLSAGARLLLPDGSAAAPVIAPSSALTTGLHFASSVPSICTAGSNRATFNATSAFTGALQMAGYFEFLNQGADPTAPAAGRARIYAINDAGKVELRGRFPSGASPFGQIQQEP